MSTDETQLEVFLGLDEPEDSAVLRRHAAAALGRPEAEVGEVRVVRRSLDARKGHPLGFRLRLEVTGPKPQSPPAVSQAFAGASAPPSSIQPPLTAATLPSRRPAPTAGRGWPPRVVLVGTGPAASFCALRLAEAGARPILVEMGGELRPRRQAIARLMHGEGLDPRSNYCFGEGGAGTFSDGKLHTRSRDRAAVAEVLLELCRFGADPEILVEARPHIGSNRLPRIVLALRRHLLELGAEYHFGDPCVDLLFAGPGPLAAGQRRVAGIRLASGAELAADAVVLAGGGSARDLYALCAARGVALAAKPFAVGVRVEHPQALIDEIQYGRHAGHPRLPPAFYQATAQVEGRGVYSFCMCPGGFVVPSATEPRRLCLNGMSLSRRDAPFANAGLVVTVEPRDFARHVRGAGDAGDAGDASDAGGDGPLAGIAFQRRIEAAAFAAGGGGYRAPAQRIDDFLAGRPSRSLGETSYRLGVTPADLGAVLPDFVTSALRAGLRSIDRKLRGLVSGEGLLLGVEMRTSAPVRMLRDPLTMQSVSHSGLYPAGEGAGYAGGMVSAAVDGLRVAAAILGSNSAGLAAAGKG